MSYERPVTTEQGGTPLDPFYAYLGLVDRLGEGQVFLLDAANESGTTYRMSLLGAIPVLEFQVKDHCVSLFAVDGLLEYLEQCVAEASQAVEPPTEVQSFVTGHGIHFMSKDPMAVLEVIRKSIRGLCPTASLAPFTAGMFGYIGYDAVHYLETLPKTTIDDRVLPDVRLQWYATTIHLMDGEATMYDAMSFLRPLLSDGVAQSISERVDVVKDAVEVEGIQVLPGHFLNSSNAVRTSDTQQVIEDISEAKFVGNVEAAKDYIRAGDIFQVVLSKRMRLQKTLHHYEVYENLRNVNPSPYMFMAEYPDMRLFGASPEVQFRTVNGTAEMKPIAGTSKGRGKTPEEDRALADRLLSDEKERAEHVMLVDLCRNDLGRVSKTGSVQVTEFLTVEPYSHLFHLVSKVTGTLREDVSVFHALLATFPAGTLSGAPKIRAMEIIDELEPYRRGPYGGMIGMIDFDANANTAIVIRTIVERDHTYYVQVGAGIVADSDAHQEWLECGHKAGAVLDVLGVRRMQSVH